MGRRTFLGLMLTLGMVNPSWAGLYNTSEPDEEKKRDPSIDERDWFPLVFRETLLKLRSIGMSNPPIDNALRKRYVSQADLAARANPAALASLSTEQKLNLSAILIRRKKLDDAIALLVPLARQEPNNFLILGNLATAYQLSGQDSRAIDTLEQALAVWPKQIDKVEQPLRDFLNTFPFAFDFYRKAETYQLKLLRLRSREGLMRKGAKTEFETVDALFDDGKNPVQFVSEDGKYEPGKLARSEKAKLPRDALDIVQQLLIWLPEDVRLYWLLGELYNAQGGPKNILAARMILDELGGYGGLGVRARELAEHRKQLFNYHNPDENQANLNDLGKRVDDDEKIRQETGFKFDWQTLLVGISTGLLLAIFGMWQIREIRRRRQKRRDITR